MSSSSPPPSLPPPTLSFILDFDKTITLTDSISPLANLAIAHQKSTQNKDLFHDWYIIRDTYVEAFSRSFHNYQPSEPNRKTLAEEITYQRKLSGLELYSFNDVSRSGIFEGITDELWWEFARVALEKGDVSVRKGFKEFVERVKEEGGRGRGLRWGVVSVNFSREFIRGVLAKSAGLGDNAVDVEILANHPDEKGVLFGPGGGKVMATSDAKVDAMNELLKKWKVEKRHEMGDSKIVYVGDSLTDIECLTEEGVVGVVMSDDGQGSLMNALKRIGYEVVHVGSPEVAKGSSIYWARDFEEMIKSPLFGLEAGKEI